MEDFAHIEDTVHKMIRSVGNVSTDPELIPWYPVAVKSSDPKYGMAALIDIFRDSSLANRAGVRCEVVVDDPRGQRVLYTGRENLQYIHAIARFFVLDLASGRERPIGWVITNPNDSERDQADGVEMLYFDVSPEARYERYSVREFLAYCGV